MILVIYKQMGRVILIILGCIGLINREIMAGHNNLKKRSINELLYVSSNKFKLHSSQKYLEKFAPNVTLVPVSIDFVEPQITNQVEIALAKAKQAYQIYQKPLLVDDVGFYISKYNNFPGTITGLVSRGLGFQGIKRLYDEGDTGYLRIVMVYIYGPEEYQIFDQHTDCILIKPKNISNQSEIFIQLAKPVGYIETFAQLMNHEAFYDVLPRSKALKELLEFLQI
jgi:inosine/xanthosine triphosphate pyrophosphatase family protein